MNFKIISWTYKKSSSNETKDSGSTEKQSSEKLSPLPDSTEFEQPSESIPDQLECLIGEYTNELSDVSDPEIYSTTSFAAKSYTSSSNFFFIWYHRINSLMRSKTVRCLAVVNIILLLINFFIILLALALLLNQIILFFRISSILNDQSLPCIFTYGPWLSCSASCWDGSANYPQMKRYVNTTSIVQARGGGKPDCPDNLDSRVDFAPCNTFRCPTNLSEYPFTQCYYKDSMKESSGGCYRIRNVPLDDRLIFMNADLMQNCSDTECYQIEKSLF